MSFIWYIIIGIVAGFLAILVLWIASLFSKSK